MPGSFTDYLANGALPARQGNQNTLLAPAGAYQVAGGRFITIAVLRDSHWQKFCAAIAREDLAADARFATNGQRLQHRAALDALIVPLLAAQPADYWIAKLRAADILCGPINSVADVLADPALAACLPLIDTGLPSATRTLGAPIRYNGEFFTADLPPPAKGQHTREVLAEFGFTAEEIEALLSSGSAFAAKAS
jgi:crotonobetainyl-CoA:carnitine CoA-transferase CaiB-like acyl-CoA transferase